MDANDLKAAITALADSGMIQVSGGLAGPLQSPAQLTEAGTSEVFSRQGRRTDQSRRAAAAREAVLDWLYAQHAAGSHSPSLGDFYNDPRSYFEGDRWAENEVNSATKYLLDKGLVDVQGPLYGAVGKPSLTTDGMDVVEQYGGSVMDYLRDQRSPMGQSIVTNIHGSGNVLQTAFGGGDVRQDQQVSQGLDAAAVVSLLLPVREAAQALPVEEQPRLLAVVEMIETEAASDDPDRGFVRQCVERLQLVAGKIGNAALAATVSAVVPDLIALL